MADSPVARLICLVLDIIQPFGVSGDWELASKPSWHFAGLLTQGVPGVPQDSLAPRRGPLGPSPDKEIAIGNAPALVPGPLAGLLDLQLLTVLSPQARVMRTSLAPPYNIHTVY
jgi:hypothetical protein